VLLAGIVARALVVFAGDWPRGINGAYYPVQVRAILRTGALALPDFPLLFYLQALFALALRPFCSGMDRAIILATQLADTVLPCLVAVPVFLLARAWVPPDRRGNLPVVVLCAGLAAVANPMVLRMAGDLQKNSAGLGLALLFVTFADRYLRDHRPAAAAGALASLLLTGLTHLGVFGMTLILAVLLGAAAVWESRKRKRLLLALPVAALVCVLVALAVFAFFDPTRIERLTGYLLSPGRFFLRPGPPGGFPGPGLGPGPGPGPMGGLRLALRPETFPGLALGLLGLWMWLLLVDVDRVQRHTTLACALTALALACPWLAPDLGNRLALMSVLPGTVCIVFALAHWPRVWGCAVAGGIAATLLLAGSAHALHGDPRGSLSPQAVKELREIAGILKAPDQTLIVARHGLEWWTSWFTGAHIANNMKAALSIWDRYQYVYALNETAPAQVPGMPGGPMPPSPGRGFLPGPHGGPRPDGLPAPGAQGPGSGPQPGQPGHLPGPPFADPRQPRPGQPGLFPMPPPGQPGLPQGPQGPPPNAWDQEAHRPGQHGTAPGAQRLPLHRQGPRQPGPPDPRGPGPDGEAPGPRPPRTEPVYSGTALRLERFLAKPPPPPARPEPP
jgi:hypothetical protein